MTEGDTPGMDLLPSEDVWAFEALKELLMGEKGFDLEAYKVRCILRRIYLRVRSKGFPSLGQYFKVLNRNPEELERLFQYLTINVTEFFRNPSAFRYLYERILPALLAERVGRGVINIWSAGCSSGEEPYSLAILVLEVMKNLGVRNAFHILATDVDVAVLARAETGRYSADALKNATEEEKSRYFIPDGDGYLIGKKPKGLVTFRAANLLVDPPGEKQDLILCRNLLIYLSREKQEKVISNFAGDMRPGGYLMLGKAETLIGRSRLYYQNISPTERIYRKRDVPLEGDNPTP